MRRRKLPKKLAKYYKAMKIKKRCCSLQQEWGELIDEGELKLCPFSH